MYNILSLVFKYIFIIIIYLFIFSIIRLIYLDIRGIDVVHSGNNVYLKLINRKETLPYRIKEHYSIGKDISLGRKSSNDIVIPDRYISKNHFKIVEDENEHYLEDLNSSNGTYVNGKKIIDIIRLKNGDRINVGKIEFLFVNKRME